MDTQTLIQLCVILPVALMALGILWWRGHLSPQSLNVRLIKPSGLTGVDLMAGLMLLILSMAVVPAILIQTTGLSTKDPLQGALLQLLMQVATFCPLIIFIIYRIRQTDHTLGQFGLTLHEPTHWQTGVWATLLGIPILMGLSTLIATLSQLLGYKTPEIAHEMLQTISQTRSVMPMVLLLTSAIIVAPLCEEFVFRGFMLQSLRDVLAENTPWMNIAVSSVIFSGTHLGVAQWQTLPALFVLGGILGWMYEKTGSLWPCIILHACFNALNIAIVLFLM